MDFQTITPCGENCAGCEKRASGYCGGCIETDGHCKEWEQSQECPIFRCARQHGAKFCGVCAEFPCDFMLRTITWREDIVSEMRKLAREYGER